MNPIHPIVDGTYRKSTAAVGIPHLHRATDGTSVERETRCILHLPLVFEYPIPGVQKHKMPLDGALKQFALFHLRK